MTAEKEKLIERLCNDPKRKLLNFNVFPGKGPFTEEDLCAELNRVLDLVDSGEVLPVDDPPDTKLPRMSVDEFLKKHGIRDG